MLATHHRRPELDFQPTMGALLARAADRYGDDDVLVTPAERQSFADLERNSCLLARRLLAAGVGKGTRVGILATYGHDWLVSFAAVTRIGAIAFPLATSYAPAELRKALRFGDVDTLLASRVMFGRDQLDFLVEAVPGLGDSPGGQLRLRDVPSLRRIWVFGDVDRPWATPTSWRSAVCSADELVSVELLGEIESEVVPADLMLMIATSGSTAAPKGVLHTHGLVVRQTSLGESATGFPATPRQRLFAGLPFFWTGGIQTVCGALHSGATMVCQERFEVDEAVRLIEAHSVTHVHVWPTLLQRLAVHPDWPRIAANVSAIGGIGVPQGRDGAVRTRLGMTETLGPHSGTGYVDHRVVDPSTGEILDEGETGEICVRGFSVMSGLHKREREDVFDSDGYYHTGDRGFAEDGWVHFAGRISEMIKSNGANVAPPEVEAVLLAMPAVKQAFVFGLPDAERGEAVACAVVAAADEDIDVEQVLRRCRRELSAFKVPRIVEVLNEDEVPLTVSSKPDKRRLRELIARRLGVPT